MRTKTFESWRYEEQILTVTDNAFLTESTGVRPSENVEVDVIDIFDYDTFNVEGDWTVADARDGEIEWRD